MQQVRLTDVPLSMRPSKEVWEVIEREIQNSSAILVQLPNDSYGVIWEDEQDPTPLQFLAYNANVGVFDTREIGGEHA